ncbi:hypothetical protein C8R44DRAFT_752599 [Mycena epipterygia]|nr:hypothetical protein C8R44DRAFT_752599 [Mycena epipterygia]
MVFGAVIPVLYSHVTLRTSPRVYRERSTVWHFRLLYVIATSLSQDKLKAVPLSSCEAARLGVLAAEVLRTIPPRDGYSLRSYCEIPSGNPYVAARALAEKAGGRTSSGAATWIVPACVTLAAVVLPCRKGVPRCGEVIADDPRFMANALYLSSPSPCFSLCLRAPVNSRATKGVPRRTPETRWLATAHVQYWATTAVRLMGEDGSPIGLRPSELSFRRRSKHVVACILQRDDLRQHLCVGGLWGFIPGKRELFPHTSISNWWSGPTGFYPEVLPFAASQPTNCQRLAFSNPWNRLNSSFRSCMFLERTSHSYVSQSNTSASTFALWVHRIVATDFANWFVSI